MPRLVNKGRAQSLPRQYTQVADQVSKQGAGTATGDGEREGEGSMSFALRFQNIARIEQRVSRRLFFLVETRVFLILPTEKEITKTPQGDCWVNE